MKRIIIVYAMALLTVTASAQVIKTVDIPQKVYDYVEFPPHYAGGVKAGIQRLFEQKFQYPEEAWKSAKVKQTEVSFLVRRDGTIVGVETDEALHPALADELKRVLPQMPKWFPAYLNGQRIDARVGLVINIVDPKTGMPYHLQTAIKSLERYTAHPHATEAMTPQQLETALSDLRVINEAYDEYKPTAITTAKLYASLGKKEEAVKFIDHASREYALLDPGRQNEQMPILSYRPGYTGKNDVALQLQRAIEYDYFGRASSARRDYDATLALAARKIAHGDIGQPDLEKEKQDEQWLRIEELMDKMFYRLTFINDRQLTDDDRIRLTTVQRTPQNIIPVIEDIIGQGRIKDVKVIQQKEQIKQLANEQAHGKVSSEDVGNLYATQALIVCLRDGYQAAHDYVTKVLEKGGLANGGKKALKKVLKKMNANAAGLSNRDMLVRVMATYAPLSGSDDCDDYYRTAAALADTFPVDWLNK